MEMGPSHPAAAMCKTDRGIYLSDSVTSGTLVVVLPVVP